MPIARLLFLLGYARHTVAWQHDTLPVAEDADLLPAVAQALWRQADRAIHQGLLPGLRHRGGKLAVLRGRLRESEQLHRHHGLPLPLEIRHDEFTVDIPENQILRTACERMLRCRVMASPSGCCATASRLRRRRRDIARLVRCPPGSRPGLTPATIRRCAWRNSCSTPRRSSTRPGTVAVTGFLLDMPVLFEDFVTVALRRGYSKRLRRPETPRPATTSIRPAGSMLRRTSCGRIGGAPVAVIDAKYKAEKPAGYPNADLYQLLAYCTVLGLTTGISSTPRATKIPPATWSANRESRSSATPLTSA